MPTLVARQEERAERILAAAEELLLRYGYTRVTIEDIARRAGIGTGTIYLHWRIHESLLGTRFLREVVALWRVLIERVRADPAEVRFHRVMRAMLLAAMSRPLARALFTSDRELLGKLDKRGFARPGRSLAYSLRFWPCCATMGFCAPTSTSRSNATPCAPRSPAFSPPRCSWKVRRCRWRRAPMLWPGRFQRAFEPPEQVPDAMLPVVAAQLLLSRLDARSAAHQQSG